jgi:hypothetical protein
MFGRIGIFVQERLARHDETGCADAALEGRILEKGLLDRIKAVDRGDPHLAAERDDRHADAGQELRSVTDRRQARLLIQVPGIWLPRPIPACFRTHWLRLTA